MNTDRQMQHVSPATTDLAPVIRFDTPQRTLLLENGRLDVIAVGRQVVGKGSYGPGWRWSHASQAQPRIGGRPEVVGVVLSGRAKATTEASGEFDLMPGDFFHLPTRHDVWVVGYRPCEILYLGGIDGLIADLESGVTG